MVSPELCPGIVPEFGLNKFKSLKTQCSKQTVTACDGSVYASGYFKIAHKKQEVEGLYYGFKSTGWAISCLCYRTGEILFANFGADNYNKVCK
jgi:hypothetical protein